MKYNLSSLEVGQSVELNGERKNISASASIHAKLKGKKFKCRSVKDGVVRVERIS